MLQSADASGGEVRASLFFSSPPRLSLFFSLQLLATLALLPRLRVLDLASGTGSFGQRVSLSLPRAVALSLPLHSLLSWKIEAPELRVLRLRPPLSGGGTQQQGVLQTQEILHLQQQALALADELPETSRQLRLVYIHLAAAQCGSLARVCECRGREKLSDEELLRVAREVEDARQSQSAVSSNGGSGAVSQLWTKKTQGVPVYVLVSQDVGALLSGNRFVFKRKNSLQDTAAVATEEDGRLESGRSTKNVADFAEFAELTTERSSSRYLGESKWRRREEGFLDERRLERSLQALPQCFEENPLLLEGSQGGAQVAAALLLRPSSKG